jgi:uncharacterized protein (DUF849 family)
VLRNVARPEHWPCIFIRAAGMGAAAWPLFEDALSRGYDVRIGLEDVLAMPDGTIAASNADLVAAAAQLSSTAPVPS